MNKRVITLRTKGEMSFLRNETIKVVVIVSANAEWKTTLAYHHDPTVHTSPFGTFFQLPLAGKEVVMFQGGWGKVSAAAGTQYVIDRWQPGLIINIGTCGGIEGVSQVGDILLAEETVIYDIHERMGDPAEALKFYATKIDLSCLVEPFPQPVRKVRLVSADQDIDPNLVSKLQEDFGAVAADWESGAIAWTAHRNNVRCLILRGVSDLVNPQTGEMYLENSFSERARSVMLPLLKALPNWIRCATWKPFE